MRHRDQRRLAALAAVAVPLALLSRAAVTNVMQALTQSGAGRGRRRPPPPGPPARPPRPPSEETIKLARARCVVHLDRADAEARRAVAANLAALDAFFAAARQRAPRFAERVLGWEGHWHLAAGLLGASGGDRHRAFLAEAFGATLFTPEQVEEQVGRVVQRLPGGGAQHRGPDARRDPPRRRRPAG